MSEGLDPWSPNGSLVIHPEEEEGYQGEVDSGMQIVAAIAPPPVAAPPAAPPPNGSSRRKQTSTREKRKGVAAEAEGSRQPKHARGSNRPSAAANETTPDPQPAKNVPASGSRRTSKVWANFERISKDGSAEMVAKCNLCNNIMKCESKNGTSHLLRHLDRVHSLNNATMDNYFLKTKKNADGSTALRNTKFDPEFARTGVALFLLGGAHPFTVVEEHGYREMMSRYCHLFNRISRFTI